MTRLRILRQGDLSELSGRPKVITRDPYNRDEETAVRDRLVDDVQPALKMEEETTSQGMQAPSRSWKSQGEDSPQSLWKKHSPSDTLILGLLASRTVRA